MYIPKHFLVEDEREKIEFIQKHNFGLLISVHECEITASPIPMLIENQNGSIIISGHLSGSNPQWKSLESNQSVLTIFQGDHAYVSPQLYESKESVPTWNFTAVHVYGKVQLLHSDDEKIVHLEKMISVLDKNYFSQWKELSTDYKTKLLKGIVAFEQTVSRMEAKFKLSQNRPLNDQINVANHLAENENSVVSGLGNLMKERLKV